MTINAKRIFAGGVATLVLTIGAAGTAAADPGTGGGPGYCPGPPGSFVSQEAHAGYSPGSLFPPGEEVSMCNAHGHGQNQSGGGVTGA